MLKMKDKSENGSPGAARGEGEGELSIEQRRHAWNVTPKAARELQEQLRKLWEGEDRLPEIRTVAGLDAAFVLTGSQALKRPPNNREAMRLANRAIGCVVMYRFPEMIEIARASAVAPLEFPYVPGLLSFREIPVLLATLAKLSAMQELHYLQSARRARDSTGDRRRRKGRRDPACDVGRQSAGLSGL